MTNFLIQVGTGSRRNLIPLALGLIAANVHKRSEGRQRCEILFVNGNNRSDLDSIVEPSVLAFPLYIWNYRTTLNLARELRERFPNVPVVCGGHQVPKRPERAKVFLETYPWVDVLVHGEGEETFADLVPALGDPERMTGIPGLTFRKPGAPDQIEHTGLRPRIADLDTIPSPFTAGLFDALLDRHPEAFTGAVWETNRGCPFTCSFCDWGAAELGKVKNFNVERLRGELGWMSDHGVNYIFLADANFGLLYERDMALAGMIADHAAEHGRPKYMMINWTKNSHERIVALAERLSKGGVTTSVTLSYQSFNKPTLEAIKRRNISIDSMRQLKSIFHARGLPTYTELILGLPEESYATFIAGLSQVISYRLGDHWIFYLCLMLENAALNTAEMRQKYGLETRQCKTRVLRAQVETGAQGEDEEVVVGSRTMSVPDWCRSYTVGYLLAALHNFRLAFFPLSYLQDRLGLSPITACEDILAEIEAHPQTYPAFASGIDHLRQQREAILASDACTSAVAELGDIQALPHEGLVAKLLDRPDATYAELPVILQAICARRGLVLEAEMLDDLIRYQRLSIPLWPHQSEEIGLTHDLHSYFSALTTGAPTEPPVRRETILLNKPVPIEARDKMQFAQFRTRAGHTLLLNEIAPVANAVVLSS